MIDIIFSFVLTVASIALLKLFSNRSSAGEAAICRGKRQGGAQ